MGFALSRTLCESTGELLLHYAELSKNIGALAAALAFHPPRHGNRASLFIECGDDATGESFAVDLRIAYAAMLQERDATVLKLEAVGISLTD